MSGLSAAGLLAGCMGDGDSSEGTPTTGTGDAPAPTTTGTGDDPADLPYIDQEGPRNLVQVAGGGTGFGGDADQGHFYYGEVTGDFDVAVHATNVSGLSEQRMAGIMVRESLDPAAPTAILRREADGDALSETSPTWITWRPGQDEPGSYVDGSNAEWLRVKRAGDTLELYGSMTNEGWKQFRTFTVPDDVDLSEDVLVGLAVTRGTEDVTYESQAMVTGTFKDLSGVDLTDDVSLGDPEYAGGVTVRDDVAHVTTLEPDVDTDAGTMTLNASVYLPDDLSEANCSFEYREFDESEWTTTDSQSLSARGTAAATVDATSRRIYLLRALADVPDNPEVEGATPTDGVTVFHSSSDDGDQSGGEEPLSPGVSNLGPGDGFAEAAPWLDDDTPVIKITEPTYEALYDAFHAPGERLIVFETSGVVDLDGRQLSIRADKCYVAGQTAPSPGITFVNGGLQIAADDCVLQHVRCRPGDYEQEFGWAPTSIQVQDTRENNVVDHCTTTWGIDENLTIGGKTNRTTYSNNLVAEALRNSTHSEGPHSMGSLINPDAKNVALLGNVWTCNENRQPRLRLDSTSAVVNNLIYYYDDGCWMDPQARSSVVGNLYLSPTTDQPIVFTESLDYGEGIPKAYVEGNDTDGDVPMVGDDVVRLDERPLWPEGLEAFSVDDVRGHNLSNAGARPADRTPHDERVVGLVRDEEGHFIDSQEEVGGYPDLAVNTHSLEVPETGVRAWLREWSRRVETTS